MAKDWVERCANRLVKAECDQHGFPDATDDLRRMLTGAIREALEKAAQTAEAEHLEDPEPEIGGPDDCYDSAINDAARAIRALGAK